MARVPAVRRHPGLLLEGLRGAPQQVRARALQGLVLAEGDCGLGGGGTPQLGVPLLLRYQDVLAVDDEVVVVVPHLRRSPSFAWFRKTMGPGRVAVELLRSPIIPRFIPLLLLLGPFFLYLGCKLLTECGSRAVDLSHLGEVGAEAICIGRVRGHGEEQVDLGQVAREGFQQGAQLGVVNGHAVHPMIVEFSGYLVDVGFRGLHLDGAVEGRVQLLEVLEVPVQDDDLGWGRAQLGTCRYQRHFGSSGFRAA